MYRLMLLVERPDTMYRHTYAQEACSRNRTVELELCTYTRPRLPCAFDFLSPIIPY